MRVQDVIRVATYGSLRSGLHNHALLDSARFIGEYKIAPEFRMVSLGCYPAVYPSVHGIPITVELYEVDTSTFSRLDCLEGYPRFYDRKEIDVGGVSAWIYYMPDSGSYADVESGDWKEYHMI